MWQNRQLNLKRPIRWPPPFSFVPFVPSVPETLKPSVEPLGACFRKRDWFLNGELCELVQRKVVAQFDAAADAALNPKVRDLIKALQAS